MKKTILAVLVFLAVNAHAQVDSLATKADIALINDKLQKSSVQFRRYSTTMTTAVVCQLTGALLVVVGANQRAVASNSKNIPGAMIAGGALSVIGIALGLSAHAHIGKAGIILSGNSLTIPIKGSRKRDEHGNIK